MGCIFDSLSILLDVYCKYTDYAAPLDNCDQYVLRYTNADGMINLSTYTSSGNDRDQFLVAVTMYVILPLVLTAVAFC
jgi:hypothetical protein